MTERAQLLKELRDKERELRFRLSADQAKNVREIRVIKKTIARIHTLSQQPATPETTSSVTQR